MKVRTLRRGFSYGLIACVLLSILVWSQTHERVPDTLRIATGAKGGLYYRFAQLLAEELERDGALEVELIETEGSVENRDLLLQGSADLALLQLGSVEFEGIRTLAPLYRDMLHVVVRKGSGIENLADLDARRIVIGPPGSGMRTSARVVLEHYGIGPDVEAPDRYFTELLDDPTLDAAIVTTGSDNPDLRRMLRRGDLELIPIDQAEAIAAENPVLEAVEIPTGRFLGQPPIPDRPIPSLAAMNALVARADAPETLVMVTLAGLYEGELGLRIAGLMPRADAARWEVAPIHPSARAFHDPYQSLGVVANLFEALAAIKELIFALGAGLYLAYTYTKGLARRELAVELANQKEHLDAFLNQTVAIERAQIGVHDPAVLRSLIDQLTDLKLRALDQLTGEEVRGDQLFAIFLTQCSSLSRKLEARLALAGGAGVASLAALPGGPLAEPEPGA